LPKKKKPESETSSEIVQVCPEFAPQFREDLLWWAKTNPKLWDRLWEMIESVMQDPFSGIGKPEPLKHLGANLWSRRINLEHRLIYRVEHRRIFFLQARFHYGC
jgi:toxin YoeB